MLKRNIKWDCIKTRNIQLQEHKKSKVKFKLKIQLQKEELLRKTLQEKCWTKTATTTMMMISNDGNFAKADCLEVKDKFQKVQWC